MWCTYFFHIFIFSCTYSYVKTWLHADRTTIAHTSTKTLAWLSLWGISNVLWKAYSPTTTITFISRPKCYRMVSCIFQLFNLMWTKQTFPEHFHFLIFTTSQHVTPINVTPTHAHSLPKCCAANVIAIIITTFATLQYLKLLWCEYWIDGYWKDWYCNIFHSLGSSHMQARRLTQQNNVDLLNKVNQVR